MLEVVGDIVKRKKRSVSVQLPQPQKLLRLKAAAAYLGMCSSTLRKYVDLGAIPARRVGNERRFHPTDLDRWVQSAPKWANK